MGGTFPISRIKGRKKRNFRRAIKLETVVKKGKIVGRLYRERNRKRGVSPIKEKRRRFKYDSVCA